MTDTLILYSTVDGQTKLICERITRYLGSFGKVSLAELTEASENDLQNFKNIILGASIRYGRHRPVVKNFVTRNKHILDKKKTAFFTVNVVARKSGKDRPENNPYLRKFLSSTNWAPNLLGVFAGKISYPEYRFLDKQVIRFIMYLTKGPTDVSKVYEFTDWKKVDTFASEFNELK